jgi:hypothetical protein
MTGDISGSYVRVEGALRHDEKVAPHVFRTGAVEGLG